MSSFSSTFDPIDRNNRVNKCPCVKKSTSKPFGSIKSMVNSSPFVYGAKKITFSVKQRETFWSPYFDLKHGAIERAIILDYVLGEKKPVNLLEKPISPALALTLLLLDNDVFKTNKLKKFLDGENTVRVNVPSTNTTTGTTTETYKQYLPGYLNIHAVDIDFSGSGLNTGFVKNTSNAKSYMIEEGVFKKLSDFPYGVKSSDIEILRGAYGYGPACIGAFLNICKFKKEIIPDLICGILIAEDSGMTVGDAVEAVQQWTGFMPQDKYFDFSIISNLGTFRILSILEEIGTYFLLSLLGHTFKKNIHFHFQLSSAERKAFEAGYLIGDVNADLTRFARYIINNRLYLEKSVEVFSISTPCIMNTDGNVVDSHLELGDYKRDFYGLTLFENNPLLEALNIGKCLEDIKELNYLVNPLPGYTISELMNKNITDCFINEIVGSITSLSDKADASVMKQKISADLKIAPRTTAGTAFDYKYSNPLYTADAKLLNKETNINLGDFTITSFDIPSIYSILETSTTNTSLSINQKDFKGSIKLSLVSANNQDLADILTAKINTLICEYNGNYGSLNSNAIKNGTIFIINKMIIPAFEIYYQGKIYFVDKTSIDFTTLEQTSAQPTFRCSVATSATVGTWAAPVLGSKSDFGSTSVSVSVSVSVLTSNEVLPVLISKVNKLLKDNNCTLEKQINSICTPGSVVKIDEDTKQNIIVALDKIGLAILRICLINAFCNSYSLDLGLQNDALRRFYNIFIGYVRDYVDISVTTLK